MEIGNDLTQGEIFLRDIISAGARDLANFFIPGSSVGVVLIEHALVAVRRAALNWFKSKKPVEQQQTFNAVAVTSYGRSRDIAQSVLVDHGFNPTDHADLVNTLASIPMTVRRAISRPNDQGHPNTLLSQLPRNEDEMQRFLPLRPPRFQPGYQVPNHDYRLELLLGQGGFAEVWKANHVYRLEQPPVALKFCLDATLHVSLRREIEILDKLNKPRAREDFVRLLDTAYNADPPFLVYEYVDGGDLASWLAGLGGKPPSESNVGRVLKLTARALTFAHQHRVVHRDLKPANIMVTRKGGIKIADFGIGAIIADAEAKQERGRTITGATILQRASTPLYADPYLPYGAPADQMVDVYAIGTIAYQLIMGDISLRIGPAWRAELQQRGVSAWLLGVIEACVDTRERRLKDAGAVLAMLEKSASDRADKKRSGVAADVVNFCIKCGKKVEVSGKFCIHCGFNIH